MSALAFKVSQCSELFHRNPHCKIEPRIQYIYLELYISVAKMMSREIMRSEIRPHQTSGKSPSALLETLQDTRLVPSNPTIPNHKREKNKNTGKPKTRNKLKRYTNAKQANKTRQDTPTKQNKYPHVRHPSGPDGFPPRYACRVRRVCQSSVTRHRGSKRDECDRGCTARARWMRMEWNEWGLACPSFTVNGSGVEVGVGETIVSSSS